MAEDARPPLVTDEDMGVFEAALDRLTWPDGGRVIPLSRRQIAAVRTAWEAAARGQRARWVAGELNELAAGPVVTLWDEVVMDGSLGAWLRDVAVDYRAGTR